MCIEIRGILHLEIIIIIIRAMHSTLWIVHLGIPVLLACFVLWTAAIPTNSDQRFLPGQENALNESHARKVQSTAGAEPANNFGIKFVPLFSLIATFIPKLLGRFGNFTRITSSRGAARSAREINTVHINGFSCSVENFGMWRDPKDCTQFYVCKGIKNVSENVHGNNRQVNKLLLLSAPLEISTKGSVSIEHHRCILDHVFSGKNNKCEPQSKTVICEKLQNTKQD